jgi:DNA polymerase III subunit gamma/tau
LVDQGQQLAELLDQLIEYWRDLMVVCCAGAKGQDLSVSGTHLAGLQQQAGAMSLDSVLAGMDLLVGAKSRLRGSSHVRVILEMTLVRLAQLEDLVSLSQLVQWVNKEGAAPGRASASSAGPGAANPARLPVAGAVTANSEKKKLASEANSGEEALLPLSEENLEAIWQQVISQAGFALASDLRKVINVAISGPNTLVMRVSERYNVPGSTAIDPVRLTRIETLVSRIVGKPCNLRLETVREEAATGSPAASGSGTSATSVRQAREKVRQLPLVQKARDLLGAEILHVDPDFGEVVAPAKPADDNASDSTAEEE